MKNLLLTSLLLFSASTYCDEYSEFWNLWHKDVKLFSQCSSNEAVASFLVKAVDPENLRNAELSEGNAEEIEKILIKNPKCILSALPLLNSLQCNNLVKHFIEDPIFHEKSEIQASIKSVHTGKVSCNGS